MTPRVWNYGDAEPPADVTRLRRPVDGDGDVVRLGSGWWFVPEGDQAFAHERTDGWPWRCNHFWPLTEVVSSLDGEWAVVDGDLFEEWPTEAIAREHMRHFYTESARLCQLVNGEWLDVDGNS